MATVNVSDSFCGQCYGFDCSDYTMLPRCMSFGYADQQACSADNGAWQSNMGGGGGFCEIRAYNYSACMAGTRCANANSPGTASPTTKCSGNECYSAAVNQSQCSYARFPGVGVSYDAGAGLCFLMTQNKTRGEAEGFTWSYGRFFVDGQYHTKELCDAGRCDSTTIPFGQPVTPVSLIQNYCEGL